ncbi:hypothetical protein E2C01_000114 [Portunus trituberculatus]|uniref:Uncharacterized protein n=1 Tax=Portunus trituberculatus TaxID=210409 RepID=A0A5B7CEB0_PORTR|nr:hypothetical protein [Portunus trituberculatus]
MWLPPRKTYRRIQLAQLPPATSQSGFHSIPGYSFSKFYQRLQMTCTKRVGTEELDWCSSRRGSEAHTTGTTGGRGITSSDTMTPSTLKWALTDCRFGSAMREDVTFLLASALMEKLQLAESPASQLPLAKIEGNFRSRRCGKVWDSRIGRKR